MGLDWHTVRPCETVKAPRIRDRAPGWELTLIEERLRDIHEAESRGEHMNPAYVEWWRTATPETVRKEFGDKYDCENCPLLRELAGADSTGSLFIGVTVKACDFRGKRVARIEELPESLREEAYRDHTTEEMLDYANRLERAMKRLKGKGVFNKAPYESYLAERERLSQGMSKEVFAFLCGETLTAEEYERALHPSEQALREAIHWLRTCAKWGVSMAVSY